MYHINLFILYYSGSYWAGSALTNLFMIIPSIKTGQQIDIIPVFITVLFSALTPLLPYYYPWLILLTFMFVTS